MSGVAPIPQSARIALGVVGVIVVGAGVVALFRTESAAAATAAMLIGALFVGLAVLAPRLSNVESLEVPGVMKIGFRTVEKLLDQAVESEQRGDDAGARELRESAWKLLENIAKEYKDLRSSMPSGAERTAALNSVMKRVRALAAHHSLEPKRVQDWVLKGDEAKRIVALNLMDAAPELRDTNAILKVVAEPSSNYEQYHGLMLLDNTFDHMTDSDKGRVIEVLVGLTKLSSDPDPTRNEIRSRIIGRWQN